MKVTAYCPSCLIGTRFRTESAPAELTCRCGARRGVTLSPSLRDKGVVDVCALCGSGYFYIEKDFNGWMGMAVMIVAIAGFAWFISSNWFIAMGFLGGAATLDFLAYGLARTRTICYQCLAAYHGTARNESHHTYDLGTAGRFADDYEEQREKQR